MNEYPNLLARNEDFRPDPKGHGAFLGHVHLSPQKVAQWQDLAKDIPVFAYVDYAKHPPQFLRWTNNALSFYIDDSDVRLWHQKAFSDDFFDSWLASQGSFHDYDPRQFAYGYGELKPSQWIRHDPENRGWASVLWDDPATFRHFGFAPNTKTIPYKVRVHALEHTATLQDHFLATLKPIPKDWIETELVKIQCEESNLPTPYLSPRFQMFNGDLYELLRFRAINERIDISEGLPPEWKKLAGKLGFSLIDDVPTMFEIPLSRHSPSYDPVPSTRHNLIR